jgi:hypothetical protein
MASFELHQHKASTHFVTLNHDNKQGSSYIFEKSKECGKLTLKS